MSACNHRQFLRESYQLLKRIDHDANLIGQVTAQISACDRKVDQRPCLVASLKPFDGPYRGSVCVFKVQASAQYPATPPEVTCLSSVYHPNISYRSGQVCFSVLSEDWVSSMGLDTLLVALLFLLYHPNLEDPLPSSSVPCGETWETFTRNVDRSLRGGLLGKRKYDRMCSWHASGCNT